MPSTLKGEEQSSTPANLAKQGSNSPTKSSSILQQPLIKNIVPFVIGGSSGMVATTVIQPVDVVKVRIQLSSSSTSSSTTGPKPTTSPLRIAQQILAEGGPSALYAGLTAGYLRQATYATLRLGFFDRFLAFFASRSHQQGRKGELNFLERGAASLGAGGLAAGISNPVEVALVRMQSDGMKPPAERARYRGVFDALFRVAKADGVIKGLWAGSGPTIVRAMATNFGQLAFFSESKAQFAKRTDWSQRTVTVAASGVAGFFASVFSLPFDFLKTRLQRGGSEYKGLLDCAGRVLREEGPLRFYRGFGTYFVRIAPHSIITLIVSDTVTAMITGK